VRITDHSRLNGVFLVTAEGQRDLVVKVGPRVAREAAILERLRRSAGSGGLVPFLPGVVAHDGAVAALVLEAPPDARDLTRHHARGRFSCALAAEAGRGLAHLHALPAAVLDGLRSPAGPAWRLPVHAPDLESVHSMSPAAMELTRIVQGHDDLCAALDETLASSAGDTVIHGDVRWDNLLAARDASSKRWARLGLIDWELCDAGDPAVDVGAFFGEYLRTWLQSIPITDPQDPGRLLAHAALPLRRMRPALRAFRDAYARHSRASAGELGRTLRRAIDLAAVRLLTAALEEAQTLDEPNARVLYLVPLSRNLLCGHDETAARLLGLDAPMAAA
jgi:aminoglycoside phosphotransferase (APT) family kinase protein